MSVESRAIAVTGGTRGTGLATCDALARYGHDVFVGCRAREHGVENSESLRHTGLEVTPLVIDVSDSN